jgi:hypothetical protein
MCYNIPIVRVGPVETSAFVLRLVGITSYPDVVAFSWHDQVTFDLADWQCMRCFNFKF